MPPNLLRFAYVCEFLLGITAIFTAWPEIGSEAALSLMPWSLKLGIGVTVAGAAVGFTRAIVSAERLISWRSSVWLGLLAALLMGAGVVTYYYMLEAESEETDEPTANTVELYSPHVPPCRLFA